MNSLSPLNIYYHNASGIRTKSKDLYLSILEENYDIIVIVETWLTVNFKTEEYFPSNYIVHRRDRYLDEDTFALGGGIVVAVADRVSSELLLLDNCDMELVAVRIHFVTFTLFICTTYIPCRSSMEQYHKFISIIESNITPILKPEDRLIIIGDFNLPNIFWQYVDDYLTPINANTEAELFISDLLSMGLKQCIDVKNSSDNFLDLAFVPLDQTVTIHPCEDLAGSSSIYHTPLKMLLFFDICEIVDNEIYTQNISYNFKKGDYQSLISFLDRYDWPSLVSNGNLDDCLNEFYRILYLGIEKFIPKFKTSRVMKHS